MKTVKSENRTIWYGESIYVDVDTGEILKRSRLRNGEYIKIKTTTKFKTNGKYKGKTITTECRKHQSGLFEQ